MLDLEPWLNETTACTFPEPFYQPFQHKRHPQSFDDGEHLPQPMPKDVKNAKAFSGKKLQQQNLRRYEGTFGNFAYGNLTVNKTKWQNENPRIQRLNYIKLLDA